MKTTITKIISMLILTVSAAYAANGAENEGSSLMLLIFLAFGAMILIFQMVPGTMLFFSMVKGLFTPGKKTSLTTGTETDKS